MAIVKIDGKSVTIPDQIAKLGKEAVRKALSIDYPAAEHAQIEIVEEKDGAPSVITVTKRAAPKGQGPALSLAPEVVLNSLMAAPAYVNPAIRLAAEVMRAEIAGDAELFRSLERSGEIMRAITESNREGSAVREALARIANAQPTSSDFIPTGF